MASYDTVNAPGGLSYGAPLVDFGIIGNLGNTYYQGQQNRFQQQQNQRQQDIANAFPGGLPLDPNGQPDYAKIMQVLAAKGGIEDAIRLAPTAAQAADRSQASQLSPLLGGVSAAPPAAPAAVPAVAQPVSLPAPANLAPTGGGDQPGSVVDIVSAKLPQDSQTAGAVIVNIAKAVGVDPNAALTPEQSARAARMIDNYVARTSARTTAGGTATAPAAAAGTPNARVADAFGSPPPAVAAQPPAQVAPQAPVAAPQVPPRDQGGQRIVPQVPLPRGFTDPQQAIMALRNEAARLGVNPYAAGQVKELNAWADRIENSLQPVKVGQAETIMGPDGRVIYQGPLAAAYGSRTGSPQTLDADAERYRQTGTLPPNMGRGIQGQQEAQQIRTRATEQELALGGDPAAWPTRWQEYRARGVGLNTGERVRASREENLNLILKVADAAIPAAIEQSEKVWRTGFVPLNKIIQGGEVATSDPELRAFGMANLQLAEAWARAMNPTGVMRNEDREKALSFLSTADSPETYRRLVNQLKTQITRERDSIRSGAPLREGDSAPAPGVSKSDNSKVIRWERGADGVLRQAQ